MDTPNLSIVIPCYNESENLPLIVDRIRESFTYQEPISTEVILVDNGSTDGSFDLMQKLVATSGLDTLIRPVRVEINQGYGFGILSGL